MIVARDENEVLDALRQVPSSELIAIDGWTGVGKTTLARGLAPKLNRACIDLDEFLGQPTGEFVSNLQVDELAAALTSGVPTIVSGVCMLEALEHAQHPDAFLAYVKRMARWGWSDEEEALGPTGSYTVIDAAVAPTLLTLEIRRYHWKWRPQHRADLIFERLEVCR